MANKLWERAVHICGHDVWRSFQLDAPAVQINAWQKHVNENKCETC